MRRHRAGFTLIEMLMVVLLIGVLGVTVTPRVKDALAAASLRSAKFEILAQLRRARATAIQRGKVARVTMSGGLVRVTVDSSGQQVAVGAPVDFYRYYRVTVSGTTGTVSYDPRGFAVGLNNAERITLSRSTKRDSVCVSRIGRISLKGCVS
jgi:prepilin-type N-terminal cleavage/methylation domain-containing protein